MSSIKKQQKARQSHRYLVDPLAGRAFSNFTAMKQQT